MRLAPSRPVTAVAEDGRAGRAPALSTAGAGAAVDNGSAGARSGATGASARAKSGAHREAALYHALAGQGAGDGRSLAELRKAALEAAAAAELPVWRRSGFWTTSLQGLKLEELDAGAQPSKPGAVPEVVARTLPERARHELVAPYFSRRLTIDRHKLEALNAALWSGGAFLYVPPGTVVEDPFEVVYAIERAGVAQYGRTLVLGAPNSEFRVHEYDLGEDFDEDGQSLHAGAFELYLQQGARCRLAQVQDWGSGEVFDVSTRFVGVGRDAYCHWLPSLLGGRLVRQHLELAVSEPGGEMAFRGLFFTEEHEHLDVFAVDLHETGPSGGDVHWRGAATGESRASFEGLIQIDPGAQQTHTYLQIHSMMLSPKARLDAIPSVLVSSDDVSASHGGTVGELDEAAIFYMQSRGLDRPTAVRVIVEGFFEPLITELEDEPLQELVRAKVARKLAAAREDIEAYATSR